MIDLKTTSDELENKINIYLKLFVILYANDTVFMAESASELQTFLDTFYLYCITWKMKVNVDKTKIMIFSWGRMPVNLQFKYNGKDIEIVKDFNYLGIYFSRSGSFKTCKKHQTEKAIKAMYEVIKKGRKHNLSISCQLDLFDKLVQPILLYGCEIWGFGNNEILERVQLKFCKLLLRLKTTTPNCIVYGELGRYLVENDIKLRMISYWGKLISGKDTKLSSICYRLLHQLSQESNINSSWLKYIKNIFDECGLSYVWINQNFLNDVWLKEIVKNSLQDQFKQTWLENIQNNSKTLNYRLFKDKLELEKYFDILEDRDLFTFCVFRTVDHKLPSEYGRWNNIQRENRVCNLCNSQDLGQFALYLRRPLFNIHHL